MKLNYFNKNTGKILVISLIFSILMIIILHAALATLVTNNFEKSASIFTESLSENVYLPNYTGNSYMLNSKNNPQYLNLVLKTLEFIKDYPAVQVSIYNANAQKIIATNKNSINLYYSNNQYSFSKLMDLITKTIIQKDKVDINNALAGQSFSEVFTSARFNYQSIGSLIKVTLPITVNFDQKIDQVIGVVEIYYDITKEWKILAKTRFFVILLLIIMSFINYILIKNNLLEANKIINQQSTEIEKLNKDLEKARDENQQKSDFLANTSHELRTPLNAIIGFSEIIMSEAMGPIKNKHYKEYAGDINISGNHLLSLINDILDYSKASAQKLEVELNTLDIRKIIATSIRLITPRAKENSLELKYEATDYPILIKADPMRLKQCLLNLLSNAVKFTPSGGKITISTIIEEIDELKFAVIKVEDTGIGIEDKDLARAMSAFGQVDSNLNRKYEGTGLGLPFTKKLVELMNGTFKIRSKIGIGTIASMKFACDL